MPVIKRYSNRKLYDTESKRYVTLEDLAEFIRSGEEVRVVDHNTGEDLTSLTLLQVVFEEEKKIGRLIPGVFLTRLIRTGGETVSSLRSRLMSMDPFQVVNDEIRRRIQVLVQQGTLSEDEAARIEDLLVRRAVDNGAVQIPVEGEKPAAEPVTSQEDLADPQEVETLLHQVELLEQQLAQLKSGSAPA